MAQKIKRATSNYDAHDIKLAAAGRWDRKSKTGMTTGNMKATPTEYKGFKFRSKSEAVFARALDLAKERSIGKRIYHWDYELPSHNESHQWDFCILMVDGVTRRMTQVLIEYKPSFPTVTYHKNLIKKINPLVERFREKGGRDDVFSSFIVWGNPWDGIPESYMTTSYGVLELFVGFEECTFLQFPDGEFPLVGHRNVEDMFGMNEEVIQEAKQYRFDLA